MRRWLVLTVLVMAFGGTRVQADATDPGNQGVVLLERGDPRGAVPLLEQSLAYREKAGARAGVWNALLHLGLAYRQLDDPRAEATLVRSLALAEELTGDSSPQVSASANEVGVLYASRGDHRRAAALFERALVIDEKVHGAKNEEVQSVLVNLGISYRELGDPRAEEVLTRSLNLAAELFGANHASTGGAADSLARVYMQRAEWVRAEALLERAHAIFIAAYGEGDLRTLAVLDQLARVALEKRDIERAIAMLGKGISLIGDTGDPKRQPMLVALLSTAGAAMSEAGDYKNAVQVLKWGVGIQENLAGPIDPTTLKILHNLGTALVSAGDLELAQRTMDEVIRRRTKVYGVDSPEIFTAMVTVAEIMRMKGDFAGADKHYRKLRPLAERVLGKNHPHFAQSILANHGAVMIALGNFTEGWPLIRVAAASQERETTAALQTGTEIERLRYVTKLAPAASALTAFALDPRAPPGAAADALAINLAFKGRALDATAATAEALRRRAGPAEQKLLAELATARRELGGLVFRGDTKATALETRVEELERQLANSTNRVIDPPVTLEAVRDALPEGAALVEIVFYRPLDLRGAGQKKWGAHRYVAYVLERTGEPRQVDLGDGAAIDAAVGTLLEALSNPANDAFAPAREVDRLVMAKIRPLLHTNWLFISPDGMLAAVPFGALVDERGRYAIEDHAITALTSGRDLLRRPRATRPGAPILLGDPAFGDRAPATETRSAGLGAIQFSSLEGTGDEVDALAKLVPGARLLTGTGASEAALKKVAGPPILHLATHGFFLSDEVEVEGSRGLTRTNDPGLIPADPLLRSGLAFAGANSRRANNGEDGILTALEASGLDLDGTRLVVLSACETGLGVLGGGDGVRGLGRAFVLAGAETLVTSLWKVSDTATRDLMIDYYKRLSTGGGRGEAMRQAQLQMLRTPATKHPYYWASFVVSGNPSSLEGRPVRPAVSRGARGCGCSGADPSGFVGAFLVLWLLLRRSQQR